MNPLEQIDAVFFWLKEKIKVGGSWGYTNIRNYVDKTPELKINPTLLNEIIKRLIDDGYITERKTAGIAGQPVYHITFNGLIFDGYVSQKEEIEAEKQWKREVERITLRNSNHVTILTWILVITSAIAAYYYGIEIYKHYWPKQIEQKK